VCIIAGAISICCGLVLFVMFWLMGPLIVLQVQKHVEGVDLSLFLSPSGLAGDLRQVLGSDIHIHVLCACHRCRSCEMCDGQICVLLLVH
jgi:hypothetical protein